MSDACQTPGCGHAKNEHENRCWHGWQHGDPPCACTLYAAQSEAEAAWTEYAQSDKGQQVTLHQPEDWFIAGYLAAKGIDHA